MSSILAGKVEFVVGVDTHRDSHTAAIVSATTGGVVDQLTVATDTTGTAARIGDIDSVVS
jgi:hypothetical protein